MNPIKSAASKLAFAVLGFSLGPNHPYDRGLLGDFLNRCSAMDKPRVLELGTKRSNPDRSTLHEAWVPHAGEYLGTDMEDGIDVDVVADIHRLTSVVGTEQFDVIISCSTFEHFKYPHLAAHEIMKALKIGGVLFIQTHHTYPFHSCPYDYFRFSREALAGLFGTKMGFRVFAADYEFPARILNPRVPSIAYEPAYLNVRLYGEKIGETPQDYVYEYDA